MASAVAPLRAYLLMFTGRPAALVAEAGTDEAPPTGVWPAMAGAVRACHLHTLVLDGRLLAALNTGWRYYEAALERGAAEETALLSLELGVCESWAGRHGAALPHFREARALTDEHTPFPVQAYVCSELAAGLAAGGDVEAAWRALEDGHRRLPAGSPLRAHLTLGRLRVLACSGRLEEAAEHAVALAGRYLARGLPANAAEALYYAARTRPSTETAARLEGVASTCDSGLFPVLACTRERPPRATRRRSARSRRRWRGSAITASRRRRRPARPCTAADGSRRAMPAGPPGCANCAVASARPGRHRCRPRNRCPNGSARWASWRCGGLDNAAIAEHLGLAGRTVANHLQTVYAKLGVRSRSQLAGLLGDGLDPLADGAPAGHGPDPAGTSGADGLTAAGTGGDANAGGDADIGAGDPAGTGGANAADSRWTNSRRAGSR